MTEPDVAAIRRFIGDQVPGVAVDDDVDVFAAGYVNSLFALQLVLWIERTFGIAIGSRDLDIDNFRTISAITHLVRRKRVEPRNAATAS